MLQTGTSTELQLHLRKKYQGFFFYFLSYLSPLSSTPLHWMTQLPFQKCVSDFKKDFDESGWATENISKIQNSAVWTSVSLTLWIIPYIFDLF